MVSNVYRVPPFWPLIYILCLLGVFECKNLKSRTVIVTDSPSVNCTCVDPASCDSSVPLIEPRLRERCSTKQICCPYNHITSIPVTDITFPAERPCTCVQPNLCRRNGVMPKLLSCDKKLVCCNKDDLIPDETNNSTDGLFIPTEAPCSCVPSDQCRIKLMPRLQSNCDVKIHICCPVTELILPTPEDKSPTPHPINCGKRDGSLVEGHIKSTQKFPWMAMILKTEVSSNGKPTKTFICGASLLTASIVLTSAHCTDKQPVSSLTVRAGEYDIRGKFAEELKPHQDRIASRVIQHSKYDSSTLINDLALIVVKEHFVYDVHIAPVCIYDATAFSSESSSWDPTKCIATGWGKPTADPTSNYSYKLKKTELSLVDAETCQIELRETYLGKNYTLHESSICARGNAGSDTCKGDGGGPLVCPLRTDPNQYVQVGVTSSGIVCGGTLPGLYASVSDGNYSDWVILNLDLLTSD